MKFAIQSSMMLRDRSLKQWSPMDEREWLNLIMCVGIKKSTNDIERPKNIFDFATGLSTLKAANYAR